MIYINFGNERNVETIYLKIIHTEIISYMGIRIVTTSYTLVYPFKWFCILYTTNEVLIFQL